MTSGHIRRLVWLLAACLLFSASCASAPRYNTDGKPPVSTRKKKSKPPGRRKPVRKFDIEPVPPPKIRVRVGQIYSGVSSFYGPDFHGKLTANGEVYDMYGRTAAHRTLPLNTIIKVTNLANSMTVMVRINDRGPYVKGRILDLSYGAAKKLGFVQQGTTRVRIEVVEVGDGEYIHHLPIQK